MSAPSINAVANHVHADPAVRGGKPCVNGTRIAVQDIYVWHQLQGMSVDEIVGRFPRLTHADVYAAMAYFWDHREAILADVGRGDQLVSELKQRFVSKLPTGGGADAVSS
jgi:uncharacterized protein (DUF433 family)